MRVADLSRAVREGCSGESNGRDAQARTATLDTHTREMVMRACRAEAEEQQR